MVNLLPFTDQQVVEAHPDHNLTLPALGQGAFKVAYRAEVKGEVRVLKVIYEPSIQDDPDEFDLDSIPERIGREVAGMAAVDSPHIVKLLVSPSLRTIGGSNYLCYEEPYYPGGTLEDRLKAGPLDAPEVRSLAVALLEASRAMWNSKKIVHRDIKPGNITFDASGAPILLDLGLALFTEMSAITQSGVPSPATPKYAAPEQFELRRNSQLDFRTDQYSIALTVFEAATGRHLFWRPGMDLGTYFQLMENFDASAVEALPLDDELKRLVGRMLSPRLYGRYRTPELALEALGVTL